MGTEKAARGDGEGQLTEEVEPERTSMLLDSNASQNNLKSRHFAVLYFLDACFLSMHVHSERCEAVCHTEHNYTGLREIYLPGNAGRPGGVVAPVV